MWYLRRFWSFFHWGSDLSPHLKFLGPTCSSRRSWALHEIPPRQLHTCHRLRFWISTYRGCCLCFFWSVSRWWFRWLWWSSRWWWSWPSTTPLPTMPTNGHFDNACPKLPIFSSYSAPSEADLAKAFFENCRVTPSDIDWYVDFGASDHVVSFSGSVSKPEPFVGDGSVHFGNDNILPITAIGLILFPMVFGCGMLWWSLILLKIYCLLAS